LSVVRDDAVELPPERARRGQDVDTLRGPRVSVDLLVLLEPASIESQSSG